MPVNTLPVRCPSTCPECQVTVEGDLIFHRCEECGNGDDTGTAGTGTSQSGCCSCIPQYMYVEFIPEPLATDEPGTNEENPFLPPLLERRRIVFGIGVWNDNTISWTAALAVNGQAIIGAEAEMYIERVADQCYFVLRSDYLGYPIGSEKKWAFSGTSEACRIMSFIEHVTGTGAGTSSEGTLRVSGGQFLENPIVQQCYPACCIPYVCYQLTVSGTVEVFDTNTEEVYGSAPFEGTIVFSDSEIWNTIYDPRYASLCTLQGVANAELGANLPCYDGVVSPATGQPIVAISGTIYGDTLYVTANARGYVSSYYRQKYLINPSLRPGNECTSRTVSLISTFAESSGLAGDEFYGTCVDGVNSATAGVRAYITSISDLEIHAGTACEINDGPCARRTACYVFTPRGVTDGTCTECGDFRNELVEIYRELGTCTYYGVIQTAGHCISELGGTSGQWVAVYNPDTDTLTLTYVIYDASDQPIGSAVIYSTSPVGTATDTVLSLSKVSSTGDCTWPDIIVLLQCNTTNTRWGACCETPSSASGLIICDMMTEAECEALDGNFLGEGTRCALEGCTECEVDCNTFCDVYELDVTINHAPCTSGLAGVVFDIERDVGGIGPCKWYGEFGAALTAEMTVDTSTTPPTRTIHCVGLADDTNTVFEFDLVPSPNNYYCDNVEIPLTITNWNWVSGDPDLCTTPPNPGDYSIRIRPKTNCPELTQSS